MDADVQIMSERAILESLTNIYNEIYSVRNEQSEMKTDIAEVKTNLIWMKQTLDNLDAKFSGCKVCADPKEITENHNKLKKVVYDLRDSFNQIKWTSAGISAGISVIILIIAFLYRLTAA